MDFQAFLRGRRPYILTYTVFAVLAVLVVQLDLWLTGASLRFGNVLYILLLGLAGLFVFLWMEYRRQQPFFRHLSRFTGNEPLDALGVLPEPVTPDQELFARAWHRLYGRLRAELSAERERGSRQVKLITQWAHQMKTPVAVIDLELQRVEPSVQALARESPGEGLVTAALASIAEENQRLSHSLQMLLNMVRIEEFAADFRVERVDLVALVRRLVNDHKREFIVNRVYPKIELPGGDGRQDYIVETDPKWLRFVLEQILSNAIKYSAPPGGGGRVVFHVDRYADRSGDDVGRGSGTVLSVSDNGIGITPQDLPRVFDPFFTGAAGRQYPQSTGMGLYLAQQVCRRLGHQISVESAPGAGTRVSISFPDAQVIFRGLETEAARRHHSLSAKVTKT